MNLTSTIFKSKSCPRIAVQLTASPGFSITENILTVQHISTDSCSHTWAEVDNLFNVVDKIKTGCVLPNVSVRLLLKCLKNSLILPIVCLPAEEPTL